MRSISQDKQRPADSLRGDHSTHSAVAARVNDLAIVVCS